MEAIALQHLDDQRAHAVLLGVRYEVGGAHQVGGDDSKVSEGVRAGRDRQFFPPAPPERQGNTPRSRKGNEGWWKWTADKHNDSTIVTTTHESRTYTLVRHSHERRRTALQQIDTPIVSTNTGPSRRLNQFGTEQVLRGGAWVVLVFGVQTKYQRCSPDSVDRATPDTQNN